MVNYHIYNGGLIATLMVQNYEVPIQRIEDFLAMCTTKIVITGAIKRLEQSEVMSFGHVQKRVRTDFIGQKRNNFLFSEVLVHLFETSSDIAIKVR